MKELEQLKYFCFKNARSNLKNCGHHWEKRKTICQTNHIVDFTDESDVPCDVAVIKNTFVGNLK